METAVKQRVKAIIKEKNVSVNSLSKSLGIIQKTLNEQINGNGNISLTTILKLLDFYPEISSEWVLRGKGDMYGSGMQTIGDHISGNGNIGHGATITNVANEENSNLKVEVRYLKQQVEDLKKDKELLTKLLTK